jgi:uncharacterized protein
MRIIYLTDIHGAFEKVKNLLYETVADVYVVSGDLIDIPFYNMESAINYHELQSYFNALRRRMGKENMVLEDFVDDLMEMPVIMDDIAGKMLDLPEKPDDIHDMGAKYQQYTIRARRVMQQKYKVLENMLSVKQVARCFCLPGNYDMDLKYTSLHERDLHLHWYSVDNIKIAGYGGADIWTAGIPERYIVNYKAGIGTDDRKNEMYNFFKAVKPDIIVTHQPPHGVHDRITFIGPSGSPALRTYCENNNVLLCMTGHIHNDWGLNVIENTIYLNPSNFGEVTTIYGEVAEGGYFYQIELEENEVQRIFFRKLVDQRIYDLADYTKTADKWHEEIIDNDRYNAIKKHENYDLKIQKYSHIPEIDLFNDIKQYFRMFQTQETEVRVDMMERAIKQLEGNLEGIAMDVVGSVNVGLSQPSSDIDVVLYLRCNSECKSMWARCTHFKNAERMLRESIGVENKFEIIDCIDLSIVEKSIREKNYECETTQRFVAYRSICRPINYRVIAPLEDMLNEDLLFRKELEGSIRAYFKIFVTTSQHIRSFDKYEARLKSIGIKLPRYIRKKIQEYLQANR